MPNSLVAKWNENAGDGARAAEPDEMIAPQLDLRLEMLLVLSRG